MFSLAKTKKTDKKQCQKKHPRENHSPGERKTERERERERANLYGFSLPSSYARFSPPSAVPNANGWALKPGGADPPPCPGAILAQVICPLLPLRGGGGAQQRPFGLGESFSLGRGRLLERGWLETNRRSCLAAVANTGGSQRSHRAQRKECNTLRLHLPRRLR